MSKLDIESNNLIVKCTTAAGRGVFTKSLIPRNELIHNFRPIIRVINAEIPGTDCDSCSNVCQNCLEVQKVGTFRTEFICTDSYVKTQDIGRIGCKYCKLYTYCNFECYKQDWLTYHKYECSIFQRLISNYGSMYILEPHIRLLIRTYVCCYLDGSFKENVLELVSNLDSFTQKRTEIFTWIEDKSAELGKAILETEISILNGLGQETMQNGNKYSIEEALNIFLRRLMCICLTNSNVFMNDSLESIGVILDLEFSLINHSCIPNTSYLRTSNNTFALLANVDLNPGTEITANYSITNFPKFIRQRYLLEQFNFDCNCKLCMQELDWYFSYNCPKCNQILCDIDLHYLFSQNFEKAFNFKGGENKICSICSNEISSDSLLFAGSIHQRALAFLILETTTPLCDGASLNDLNLDKIVQHLDLPIEQLIDLMSLSYKTTLELNHYSQNVLGKLLNELGTVGNIIPSYCFPYSIFFNSMKVYQESLQPIEILSVGSEHVVQYTNYAVKLCFEVDIPSILGQAKLSIIHLLNNLGNELLRVIDIVLKSKKSQKHYFQSTSWAKYQDDYIIEVLIKSSYCILRQALEYCNHFYNSINVLLELIQRNIDYSLRQLKRAKFIGVLRRKNRNNGSLKNCELLSFVSDLFMLAKVTNIQCKKSKINVQFSDRDFVTIFTPFEE